MTTLAAVTDLSIRFNGTAALDGITLAINAGERLAVIGESGSGKSTLALALSGLLPATAQQAGIIGWPQGRPTLGHHIGMVFQDPSSSLDPVLTIGEQVPKAPSPILASIGPPPASMPATYSPASVSPTQTISCAPTRINSPVVSASASPSPPPLRQAYAC